MSVYNSGPRCSGTTKDGSDCNNIVSDYGEYCFLHWRQEYRNSSNNSNINSIVLKPIDKKIINSTNVHEQPKLTNTNDYYFEHCSKCSQIKIYTMFKDKFAIDKICITCNN